YGITTDGTGNIYAADAGNKRIRKITPDGTVSTFAYPGNFGMLSTPTDVVIDKEGYLLFADAASSWIGKIPPSGYLANNYGTFAGGTTSNFGIILDKNGVVYVSGFYDNQIRKITGQ